MTTRIPLADDHEIVREGLRLLLQRLGFEVIGEAANGHDAIRLAAENCPDVAVLDYGMPLLNGIGAAREIMRVCPRTKVILLTMQTDDHYVLEALQTGIKGFVVKGQGPADLTKSALPADPLTPREREVLQLVAESKTTKEVAKLLGISAKTVESHRTRILKKLDTPNTAGLVRYAIRLGLTQV